MPVFIQSAVAISPQDTFLPGSLQSPGAEGTGIQPLAEPGFYICLHPEYKQYINPTALRRMSPVIRMGLTASMVCMEKAGLEKPDAILVGSGLGCVRDTAKFLNQVIHNQELLLNPTAFIQSTHNTVSGQIALMLGCRAYNLTFSQNNLSFESALLEGMMLLGEGEARNILLGGIDEVVEESFQVMDKNGCVNGPIGEGSNFFAISSEHSALSLARLDGMEILSHYANPEDIVAHTRSFLSSKGVREEEIDLFVSGRHGDERYDEFYRPLEGLFQHSALAEYKHLVGEYDTASAFGLWLATKIIEGKHIPDAFLLRQGNHPIRRALLFNQGKGRDFSWILLSNPES